MENTVPVQQSQFCGKCGKAIMQNAGFCSACGQPTSVQAMPQQAVQTKHNDPRCTCCGYTGPWKVDSLFRPMDWVIGIALLFLFGTGLIYLAVVGLIRGTNKDTRAKICPQCKARNLWTFIY